MQVDLCGRAMNIGRPKGYVEPPAGSAPVPVHPAAAALLLNLGPQPTTVLLLVNPLPAGQLRSSDDCRIVRALCCGWACAALLDFCAAPGAIFCYGSFCSARCALLATT